MGGRVFNSSSPIEIGNIKPTIHRFVQELSRIFPKAAGYLKGLKTLGSTGKKSVSGDIDLALDKNAFKNLEDWNINKEEFQEYFKRFKSRARTASEDQIARKTCIELIARKIQEESSKITVDTKGSSNGTLFCQFFQYGLGGKVLGKRVQIDVNVGNLDLLDFAYYSDKYPEGDKIKGLHRTQLLVALFVNKGYIFSHNVGVKSKETGKVVADTSEDIIKLLNDLYNTNLTREDLQNYYKLQNYLDKHLSDEDKSKVYGTYLRILDRIRCDIPRTLENMWLDRQEELGLTGKFLPQNSVLYPFREED